MYINPAKFNPTHFNPTRLNPTQRKQAFDLITAFLNDKLKKSHDEMWYELEQSDDPVVKYAINTLADHYEPYEFYSEWLSKSEWDHLQRVLLLLTTDLDLSERDIKLKNACRLCSWLGIICFVVFVAATGIGWHLLAGMAVLEVSILIWHHWIPCTERKYYPYQDIIEPFRTIKQLHSTYRQYLTFRKQRYPREYFDARKTSWPSTIFGSIILWTLVTGVVVVLSPFLLLMCAREMTGKEYEVVSK